MNRLLLELSIYYFGTTADLGYLKPGKAKPHSRGPALHVPGNPSAPGPLWTGPVFPRPPGQPRDPQFVPDEPRFPGPLSCVRRPLSSQGRERVETMTVGPCAWDPRLNSTVSSSALRTRTTRMAARGPAHPGSVRGPWSAGLPSRRGGGCGATPSPTPWGPSRRGPTCAHHPGVQGSHRKKLNFRGQSAQNVWQRNVDPCDPHAQRGTPTGRQE